MGLRLASEVGGGQSGRTEPLTMGSDAELDHTKLVLLVVGERNHTLKMVSES